MSINSMNTRGPLSPAQRQDLALARDVQANVLKTAGRFQALDGQAADSAQASDIVLVTNANRVDLPQSMGNKIAKMAVGILAPQESQAKASGFSNSGPSGLNQASIVTETADGISSEFQFKRLDDGSELYQGPTANGYAVIKENKKDGTLAVLLTDGPDSSAFRGATDWNLAESLPKTAPTPTFQETLRSLATGVQAQGLGTHQATNSPEVVPAQPGFLGAFGDPPKVGELVDQAKLSGEKVLEDANQAAKKAGDSVKAWSESETASKIGHLLFGKLNPFGKKS